MINKSQLISFLATSNSAKSRLFYEKILGLHFLSDDEFALVFEANETMLRIQKVSEVKPQGYTALGWKVADIKKEVIELAKQGVVFSRYPGMEQDEDGIWTAPSGAKIAWFADPDNNILSLTEFIS